MNDRRDGEMTEAELVRQLGELPRRIQPHNDPWPKIASRIAAQPARPSRLTTPWFSLAAGVALAFAVGVFAGKNWQTTTDQSLSTGDMANLDTTSSLGGALAGAEREYQAAFSEFATIGQSSPALKPTTLEAIEHDWQAMLDAEAALNIALEQYPNNAWLNQRMLELRDRQLKMLKQLAGLERSSRRTEI